MRNDYNSPGRIHELSADLSGLETYQVTMLRLETRTYVYPCTFEANLRQGATPGFFFGVFLLIIRMKHSFFQQKLYYFRYIYLVYSSGRKTRLTGNGISPEPNLCWCKLNTLD